MWESIFSWALLLLSLHMIRKWILMKNRACLVFRDLQTFHIKDRKWFC